MLRVIAIGLLLFGPLAQRVARPTAPGEAKLRVEEVGSDSAGFHVVAALIIGPTEVVAWDAQYHAAPRRARKDRKCPRGRT